MPFKYIAFVFCTPFHKFENVLCPVPHFILSSHKRSRRQKTKKKHLFSNNNYGGDNNGVEMLRSGLLDLDGVAGVGVGALQHLLNKPPIEGIKQNTFTPFKPYSPRRSARAEGGWWGTCRGVGELKLNRSNYRQNALNNNDNNPPLPILRRGRRRVSRPSSPSSFTTSSSRAKSMRGG